MILYPERAHRVNFQYWPLVYFSCCWFLSGEPPTCRAVSPVLSRRHQRWMWVKWSNKQCNSHGKILPPARYYHNIQLLTASLFFPRLDLRRWSPYVELCWQYYPTAINDECGPNESTNTLIFSRNDSPLIDIITIYNYRPLVIFPAAGTLLVVLLRLMCRCRRAPTRSST